MKKIINDLDSVLGETLDGLAATTYCEMQEFD